MTDLGDSAGPARGGLFDSLRALLGTLAAMAQTRVELLGTELEEEIHRIVVMLLGAMAVLALCSLALLFGAVLVVTVFWDTHRNAAVAGVGIAFLALAAITGMVLRSNVRRRSRLLAATVVELERDRQLLTQRVP